MPPEDYLSLMLQAFKTLKIVARETVDERVELLYRSAVCLFVNGIHAFASVAENGIPIGH